jgi:hypothetical protein
MYKKILIPTDGSTMSNVASQAGIEFAKQLGADVVGLFVAPEYQYPVFVEIIPPSFPTEDEYIESMRKAGDIYLKTVRDAAEAAGVAFSGLVEFSDATALQIRPQRLGTGLAGQRDCKSAVELPDPGTGVPLAETACGRRTWALNRSSAGCLFIFSWRRLVGTGSV